MNTLMTFLYVAFWLGLAAIAWLGIFAMTGRTPRSEARLRAAAERRRPQSGAAARAPRAHR